MLTFALDADVEFHNFVLNLCSLINDTREQPFTHTASAQCWG